MGGGASIEEKVYTPNVIKKKSNYVDDNNDDVTLYNQNNKLAKMALGGREERDYDKTLGEVKFNTTTSLEWSDTKVNGTKNNKSDALTSKTINFPTSLNSPKNNNKKNNIIQFQTQDVTRLTAANNVRTPGKNVIPRSPQIQNGKIPIKNNQKLQNSDDEGNFVIAPSVLPPPSAAFNQIPTLYQNTKTTKNDWSDEEDNQTPILSPVPNSYKIPIRPFPVDGGDPDDGMIANFVDDDNSPQASFVRPKIVPTLEINTPPQPSKGRTTTPIKVNNSIPKNILDTNGLKISIASAPSPNNSPIKQSQQFPNSLKAPTTPINNNLSFAPSTPPINIGSQVPGNTSVTPNRGRPKPNAPRPQGNSPHSVKDTKDVKRNRALLPATLIHAKPTTGDWLKKRYIVNNYILLDTLGTGSYGEVRMCKERTSDQLFAIKIISKDMLNKKKGGNTSETYFEDIKREIAIMKKLLHPNVLRLYEVLDDPNVNKMYLVLEYMKRGDLVNVLKEKEENSEFKNNDGTTSLPDLELWNIFRQVVAGLRYLHYQNVVHGDIKPQNLLVGEDGIVKIADFGISKMLNVSSQNLTDAVGTPAFMSPELTTGGGESFSGQLADVWAMGATIFMLRFGQPPFVAGNIMNLYNKIQNDPLVFPSKIDINLQDLLENCLIKSPAKRFTLQQVGMHMWLRHPPAVVKPSTSSTLSPKSSDKGRKSVKGEGIFAPPPSYDKEQADAMKIPVASVNNEELFRSIGVFKKEKSGDDDSDDDYAEVADDSDMMATKWGDDLFEIVDDEDDDDDEVDDVSDEEVDDKPVDVKEKRKWNLGKKPEEEEEKKIEVLVTTNSMSKEEEERRGKKFLTKLTRKSNEDMSSIDQNKNGNKNKSKNKENDYEDEEINSVNMDDFSKMMDTMAMQPRVNKDDDDESSKPLSISLQASEFSAQLRNLSNGIGAAFHSEQGGRPTQEDRCVLAPDVTLMKSLDGYDYPPGTKEALSKFTLGCVFDGHSGWRCSQFLSQQLAGYLVTHEKFLSKKMDESITEVFKNMDIKVCDLLQKEYDSSGSTAIVAIYDGRKHVLTVANVGDSMCILSRGGRAVKMSKMHRVDDEEEKKRVIAAGGTVINNRVNGSLAVTRAFGDTQFKDQDYKSHCGPVIAIPEIVSEIITPMTEFCVIATDGLWDIMSAQTAINFVRKQLKLKKDLQESAKELILEAIRCGSVDNVTALIISFHMPPPENK